MEKYEREVADKVGDIKKQGPYTQKSLAFHR